ALAGALQRRRSRASPLPPRDPDAPRSSTEIAAIGLHPHPHRLHLYYDIRCRSVRLRPEARALHDSGRLELCMKIAKSSLLLLAALVLLDAPTAQSQAQAPTRLSVVLNFAADGGAAGFYHALERGYFRELGLDVTIQPSRGSADAITRAAS